MTTDVARDMLKIDVGGSDKEISDRMNPSPHFLEDLTYRYGSDKSRDDHANSNEYQMLFDPIRMDVRNVMELGVATGKGLQVWYDYFVNALIHSYAIGESKSVTKLKQHLKDRVRFHKLNLLDVKPYNLAAKADLHDNTWILSLTMHRT